MKTVVLRYGLIAGGLLSAMLAATQPFQDAIGFDYGMVVGYTTMILSFLLIFFGVRKYREQQPRQQVSFGRAFGVGMLIMLVASACYTATWQVIYFGGESDFMAKYRAHQMAKLEKQGATPAEVETQAAEFDKFAAMYQNPLFNSAVTMLEPLPVGLVISLITAGVLSRKRRDDEDGVATSEPQPSGARAT